MIFLIIFSLIQNIEVIVAIIVISVIVTTKRNSQKFHPTF